MSMMASQITSLNIVYSTVYIGANQRKHQRSASLAFVMGIHRSSVNSLHKRPVTRIFFLLMTSSWLTNFPFHGHRRLFRLGIPLLPSVYYFSRKQMRTLVPEGGRYCGVQLLIPAWDTCFWRQSPQMFLKEYSVVISFCLSYCFCVHELLLRYVVGLISSNDDHGQTIVCCQQLPCFGTRIEKQTIASLQNGCGKYVWGGN